MPNDLLTLDQIQNHIGSLEQSLDSILNRMRPHFDNVVDKVELLSNQELTQEKRLNIAFSLVHESYTFLCHQNELDQVLDGFRLVNQELNKHIYKIDRFSDKNDPDVEEQRSNLVEMAIAFEKLFGDMGSNENDVRDELMLLLQYCEKHSGFSESLRIQLQSEPSIFQWFERARSEFSPVNVEGLQIQFNSALTLS